MPVHLAINPSSLSLLSGNTLFVKNWARRHVTWKPPHCKHLHIHTAPIFASTSLASIDSHLPWSNTNRPDVVWSCQDGFPLTQRWRLYSAFRSNCRGSQRQTCSNWLALEHVACIAEWLPLLPESWNFWEVHPISLVGCHHYTTFVDTIANPDAAVWSGKEFIRSGVTSCRWCSSSNVVCSDERQKCKLTYCCPTYKRVVERRGQSSLAYVLNEMKIVVMERCHGQPISGSVQAFRIYYELSHMLDSRINSFLLIKQARMTRRDHSPLALM